MSDPYDGPYLTADLLESGEKKELFPGQAPQEDAVCVPPEVAIAGDNSADPEAFVRHILAQVVDEVLQRSCLFDVVAKPASNHSLAPSPVPVAVPATGPGPGPDSDRDPTTDEDAANDILHVGEGKQVSGALGGVPTSVCSAAVKVAIVSVNSNVDAEGHSASTLGVQGPGCTNGAPQGYSIHAALPRASTSFDSEAEQDTSVIDYEMELEMSPEAEGARGQSGQKDEFMETVWAEGAVKTDGDDEDTLRAVRSLVDTVVDAAVACACLSEFNTKFAYDDIAASVSDIKAQIEIPPYVELHETRNAVALNRPPETPSLLTGAIPKTSYYASEQVECIPLRRSPRAFDLTIPPLLANAVIDVHEEEVAESLVRLVEPASPFREVSPTHSSSPEPIDPSPLSFSRPTYVDPTEVELDFAWPPAPRCASFEEKLNFPLPPTEELLKASPYNIEVKDDYDDHTVSLLKERKETTVDSYDGVASVIPCSEMLRSTLESENINILMREDKLTHEKSFTTTAYEKMPSIYSESTDLSSLSSEGRSTTPTCNASRLQDTGEKRNNVDPSYIIRKVQERFLENNEIFTSVPQFKSELYCNTEETTSAASTNSNFKEHNEHFESRTTVSCSSSSVSSENDMPSLFTAESLITNKRSFTTRVEKLHSTNATHYVGTENQEDSEAPPPTSCCKPPEASTAWNVKPLQVAKEPTGAAAREESGERPVGPRRSFIGRSSRRRTPPRDAAHGHSPLRTTEDAIDALFCEGESLGDGLLGIITRAVSAPKDVLKIADFVPETSEKEPVSHSGDRSPSLRFLNGDGAPEQNFGTEFTVMQHVDVYPPMEKLMPSNTLPNMTVIGESRETKAEEMNLDPERFVGMGEANPTSAGPSTKETSHNLANYSSDDDVQKNLKAKGKITKEKLEEPKDSEEGNNEEEDDEGDPIPKALRDGQGLSRWLKALARSSAVRCVSKRLRDCLRSWLEVYLRGETLLPSSADGPADVFEVSPEVISELLRRARRPVVPIMTGETGESDKLPEMGTHPIFLEDNDDDAPSEEEDEERLTLRVLELLDRTGTEQAAGDREAFRELLHDYVDEQAQKRRSGPKERRRGFLGYLCERRRDDLAERLHAFGEELEARVHAVVREEASQRAGLARGEDRRRLREWVPACVHHCVEQRLGPCRADRDSSALLNAPVAPSQRATLRDYIEEMVDHAVRDETALKEIQRKRLRVLLSVMKKQDLREWLRSLEKELKGKNDEVAESRDKQAARKTLRGGKTELEKWIKGKLYARLEMAIDDKELGNKKQIVDPSGSCGPNKSYTPNEADSLSYGATTKGDVRNDVREFVQKKEDNEQNTIVEETYDENAPHKDNTIDEKELENRNKEELDTCRGLSVFSYTLRKERECVDERGERDGNEDMGKISSQTNLKCQKEDSHQIVKDILNGLFQRSTISDNTSLNVHYSTTKTQNNANLENEVNFRATTLEETIGDNIDELEEGVQIGNVYSKQEETNFAQRLIFPTNDVVDYVDKTEINSTAILDTIEEPNYQGTLTFIDSILQDIISNVIGTLQEKAVKEGDANYQEISRKETSIIIDNILQDILGNVVIKLKKNTPKDSEFSEKNEKRMQENEAPTIIENIMEDLLRNVIESSQAKSSQREDCAVKAQQANRNEKSEVTEYIIQDLIRKVIETLEIKSKKSKEVHENIDKQRDKSKKSQIIESFDNVNENERTEKVIASTTDDDTVRKSVETKERSLFIRNIVNNLIENVMGVLERKSEKHEANTIVEGVVQDLMNSVMKGIQTPRFKKETTLCNVEYIMQEMIEKVVDEVEIKKNRETSAVIEYVIDRIISDVIKKTEEKSLTKETSVVISGIMCELVRKVVEQIGQNEKSGVIEHLKTNMEENELEGKEETFLIVRNILCEMIKNVLVLVEEKNKKETIAVVESIWEKLLGVVENIEGIRDSEMTHSQNSENEKCLDTTNKDITNFGNVDNNNKDKRSLKEDALITNVRETASIDINMRGIDFFAGILSAVSENDRMKSANEELSKDIENTTPKLNIQEDNSHIPSDLRIDHTTPTEKEVGDNLVRHAEIITFDFPIPLEIPISSKECKISSSKHLRFKKEERPLATTDHLASEPSQTILGQESSFTEINNVNLASEESLGSSIPIVEENKLELHTSKDGTQVKHTIDFPDLVLNTLDSSNYQEDTYFHPDNETRESKSATIDEDREQVPSNDTDTSNERPENIEQLQTPLISTDVEGNVYYVHKENSEIEDINIPAPLTKKESIHVIKKANANNPDQNVQYEKSSPRDERVFSETESVTFESEYDTIEIEKSTTEIGDESLNQRKIPEMTATNLNDFESLELKEKEEHARLLREQEAEIMEKLYKAWAQDPLPVKTYSEFREDSRSRTARPGQIQSMEEQKVRSDESERQEARDVRHPIAQNVSDDDMGTDSRQFLHEEIDAELFEQYQAEDESRAVQMAMGTVPRHGVHPGGEDINEDASEMRDWLEEYIQATVTARLEVSSAQEHSGGLVSRSAEPCNLSERLLLPDRHDCSRCGGRAHAEGPDAHSTTCVRGSDAALWQLDEGEERDPTPCVPHSSGASIPETHSAGEGGSVGGGGGGGGESPTGEELLLQRFLQDAAVRAGETESRTQLLRCLRRFVSDAVERIVESRRSSSDVCSARTVRPLSRTWSLGRCTDTSSAASREGLCAGLKEQAKTELREWLSACVERRLDERLGSASPSTASAPHKDAASARSAASAASAASGSGIDVAIDGPGPILHTASHEIPSSGSLLAEPSLPNFEDHKIPPATTAHIHFASDVSVASSVDVSASVQSNESFDFSADRTSVTARDSEPAASESYFMSEPSPGPSTEPGPDVIDDLESNASSRNIVDGLLSAYRGVLTQRLSELLNATGTETTQDEEPQMSRLGDTVQKDENLEEECMVTSESQMVPSQWPNAETPSPIGTPRSGSAVGAIHRSSPQSSDIPLHYTPEGDVVDEDFKKEQEELQINLSFERSLEHGDAETVDSPSEPPGSPPQKSTEMLHDPWSDSSHGSLGVLLRSQSVVGSTPASNNVSSQHIEPPANVADNDNDESLPAVTAAHAIVRATLDSIIAAVVSSRATDGTSIDGFPLDYLTENDSSSLRILPFSGSNISSVRHLSFTLCRGLSTVGSVSGSEGKASTSMSSCTSAPSSRYTITIPGGSVASVDGRLLPQTLRVPSTVGTVLPVSSILDAPGNRLAISVSGPTDGDDRIPSVTRLTRMSLHDLLESGHLSSPPFPLQSLGMADEGEALLPSTDLRSVIGQENAEHDNADRPDSEPLTLDIRVSWVTVHTPYENQESSDDLHASCGLHDSDVCMLERLSYLHSEDYDDNTHLYNLFDDKQVQVLDFNVDEDSSTVSERGVINWASNEPPSIDGNLRTADGCVLALPSSRSSEEFEDDDTGNDMPVTVATSSVDDLLPNTIRDGGLVMDDFSGLVMPGMQGYWFGENGRVAVQSSSGTMPLHDITDELGKPERNANEESCCTSGQYTCISGCGCPGDLDSITEFSPLSSNENIGATGLNSDIPENELPTSTVLTGTTAPHTSTAPSPPAVPPTSDPPPSSTSQDGQVPTSTERTESDRTPNAITSDNEEDHLARALRQQEQHDATKLRPPVTTAANRAARVRPDATLQMPRTPTPPPPRETRLKSWETEQFDVESKAESDYEEDEEEEEEKDCIESIVYDQKSFAVSETKMSSNALPTSEVEVTDIPTSSAVPKEIAEKNKEAEIESKARTSLVSQSEQISKADESQDAQKLIITPVPETGSPSDSSPSSVRNTEQLVPGIEQNLHESTATRYYGPNEIQQTTKDLYENLIASPEGQQENVTTENERQEQPSEGVTSHEQTSQANEDTEQLQEGSDTNNEVNEADICIGESMWPTSNDIRKTEISALEQLENINSTIEDFHEDFQFSNVVDSNLLVRQDMVGSATGGEQERAEVHIELEDNLDGFEDEHDDIATRGTNNNNESTTSSEFYSGIASNIEIEDSLGKERKEASGGRVEDGYSASFERYCESSTKEADQNLPQMPPVDRKYEDISPPILETADLETKASVYKPPGMDQSRILAPDQIYDTCTNICDNIETSNTNFRMGENDTEKGNQAHAANYQQSPRSNFYSDKGLEDLETEVRDIKQVENVTTVKEEYESSFSKILASASSPEEKDSSAAHYTEMQNLETANVSRTTSETFATQVQNVSDDNKSNAYHELTVKEPAATSNGEKEPPFVWLNDSLYFTNYSNLTDGNAVRDTLDMERREYNVEGSLDITSTSGEFQQPLYGDNEVEDGLITMPSNVEIMQKMPITSPNVLIGNQFYVQDAELIEEERSNELPINPQELIEGTKLEHIIYNRRARFHDFNVEIPIPTEVSIMRENESEIKTNNESAIKLDSKVSINVEPDKGQSQAEKNESEESSCLFVKIEAKGSEKRVEKGTYKDLEETCVTDLLKSAIAGGEISPSNAFTVAILEKCETKELITNEPLRNNELEVKESFVDKEPENSKSESENQSKSENLTADVLEEKAANQSQENLSKERESNESLSLSDRPVAGPSGYKGPSSPENTSPVRGTPTDSSSGEEDNAVEDMIARAQKARPMRRRDESAQCAEACVGRSARYLDFHPQGCMRRLTCQQASRTAEKLTPLPDEDVDAESDSEAGQGPGPLAPPDPAPGSVAALDPQPTPHLDADPHVDPDVDPDRVFRATFGPPKPGSAALSFETDSDADDVMPHVVSAPLCMHIRPNSSRLHQPPTARPSLTETFRPTSAAASDPGPWPEILASQSARDVASSTVVRSPSKERRKKEEKKKLGVRVRFKNFLANAFNIGKKNRPPSNK